MGSKSGHSYYIDEFLEGVQRLMESDDFHGPVNIGSEEEMSINEVTEAYIEFSGKNLRLKHIKGTQGTRNRISDNSLIFEKLGWKPSGSTRDGLRKLFNWLDTQIS